MVGVIAHILVWELVGWTALLESNSLRFRKLQRDLLLDDLSSSSNLLCFSTVDRLYVSDQ